MEDLLAHPVARGLTHHLLEPDPGVVGGEMEVPRVVYRGGEV
jgi:hypothetical protein